METGDFLSNTILAHLIPGWISICGRSGGQLQTDFSIAIDFHLLTMPQLSCCHSKSLVSGPPWIDRLHVIWHSWTATTSECRLFWCWCSIIQSRNAGGYSSIGRTFLVLSSLMAMSRHKRIAEYDPVPLSPCACLISCTLLLKNLGLIESSSVTREEIKLITLSLRMRCCID